MLDEKSKTDKWSIEKLNQTKHYRKFWISFLVKNWWVLKLFFVIFCVLWRAISWGFGINVSFTSWSSAILLIFDTCKILRTVSFWGFSSIPQLDSHWVAGGSLWFPYLLATRPGRSGAGSGWPLTLWSWAWSLCGSYLGFHPSSLQQSFVILPSVKNTL